MLQQTTCAGVCVCVCACVCVCVCWCVCACVCVCVCVCVCEVGIKYRKARRCLCMLQQTTCDGVCVCVRVCVCVCERWGLSIEKLGGVCACCSKQRSASAMCLAV